MFTWISYLVRGAYLYRRERKKGGSNNAGAGPAKRARHGFSDDGSSSSTQPDGNYILDHVLNAFFLHAIYVIICNFMFVMYLLVHETNSC